MTRRFFFAPFVLALLPLVVSTTPAFARKQEASSTVQSMKFMDLPAPEWVAADGRYPYLLGPFDKISISVFGNEELSVKEIQVDTGGHVTFPLVGEVAASGKSPAALASDIAAGLKARYVRDPQVTVSPVDIVSQTVTVDGQVEAPGAYPIPGRMTMVQAVATAKGTTEFSRQSRVLVFRTVNGERLAGVYNLKAIRNGQQSDPTLYPGDVVVVGESATARLIKNLVGIVPVISTPIVLLLTRK